MLGYSTSQDNTKIQIGPLILLKDNLRHIKLFKSLLEQKPIPNGQRKP